MRRIDISLAVVLTAALAGSGVAGCSSAGAGRHGQIASARARGTASTRLVAGAAAGGKYYVGDHDDDDFKHSALDSDDFQVRTYGHVARSVDKRRISAVLMRYLGAAGAGDGALACSLLTPRVAMSDLSAAVTDAYVPPPDPSSLHGKSCAEAASRIFEENNNELAAEIPTVRVTAVRVSGTHGLALLGFKATPERWIAVAREGGTWKVDGLLDSEIP
jgi:hypothetical protein